MKYKHLIDNNKEKVILFFSGWGMDENPFKFLKSKNHDVIIFYDFSTLDLKLLKEIKNKYKKFNLISWSLGVPISNYIFTKETFVFTNSIAINGTTRLISNKFGIPEEFYKKTLGNFSNKTLDNFYLRMCKQKKNIFLKNKPRRNIKNIEKELKIFNRYNIKEEIFTNAIISNEDKIIPPKNQIAFWGKTNKNYTLIQQPHFCFYKWKYWEEIFETQ